MGNSFGEPEPFDKIVKRHWLFLDEEAMQNIITLSQTLSTFSAIESALIAYYCHKGTRSGADWHETKCINEILNSYLKIRLNALSGAL